jgi:hypothetical protein
MTRSAFHRQGPFVGSGGPYSPGPATTAPLTRRRHRWMTLSRHPGPSPVCDRFRFETDSSNTPSKRHPLRSSRTEDCAALGPRSLGPLPLFGGRVRAYSRPDARLPTSATALRRAGTWPELSILAGTEASTSFLFLRATRSPLRERWSAASRAPSVRTDPSDGSSHSRGFAHP